MSARQLLGNRSCFEILLHLDRVSIDDPTSLVILHLQECCEGAADAFLQPAGTVKHAESNSHDCGAKLCSSASRAADEGRGQRPCLLNLWVPRRSALPKDIMRWDAAAVRRRQHGGKVPSASSIQPFGKVWTNASCVEFRHPSCEVLLLSAFAAPLGKGG